MKILKLNDLLENKVKQSKPKSSKIHCYKALDPKSGKWKKVKSTFFLIPENITEIVLVFSRDGDLNDVFYIKFYNGYDSIFQGTWNDGVI